MKPKKRKREFNDLIIPILLVIAVLPFVTRLITYASGLSGYPWFSDQDITNDFFSYYKSLFFLILSIIIAVILIPYFMLQRGKLKTMKPFLPIGVYCLMVILSAVFTVNSKLTLVGGIAHFESVFILSGYVILLLYVYQINKEEEDYRIIYKAVLISLAVMSIIGLFQMLGRDLLYYTWLQKLIIPRADWKDFLGRLHTRLSTDSVSLTLFNPNYASVYLAMLIPFVLVQLIPAQQNKSVQKAAGRSHLAEKLLTGGLLLFLTLLLFKTYSRSGLVSLVISLLVMGFLCRGALQRLWKQCLLLALSAVILFTAADAFTHFKYLHKILGTVQSFHDGKNENALDKILTNQNNILISYDKESITISLEEGTDSKPSLEFQNEAGEDITKYYDEKSKRLEWGSYSKLQIYGKELDNETYLYCIIDGITWRFYNAGSSGYRYINDFGKTDKLTEIKHLGPKGLEDIGSGRGYIWSRSIPLLKDTLILGKGPDTFPVVFPQSDYVGKANNCKTPYTLIEKPHSFYLMTGIQTGVVSLLAFILFYLGYLINSLKIYNHCDLTSFRLRMGLGCMTATLSYMISGLFNDSSLQTTPVFIVLLGLGLDINYSLRKTR